MTDDQKLELVSRVEQEIGIGELFRRIGLQEVKPKGKNVYAVCPFHEGADNPMGFAWSNGFGFCFTQCNRKYDLFSITMRAKGYDFLEAVTYLAELVGMDIDYHKSVTSSSDSLENRSFLSQRRKIKSKNKQVDWTPIDPSVFDDIEPALHTMLRKEGYDQAVREFFNLGFARSGYLANRITVPIDYVDGSIVTISGRSVLTKDEIEMNGVRRYQIWFDTDKSVTLYNISRALPFIEFTGEVFVFEGFKSVWRLYQWGYPNAVATMGTSFSEEQRKILLKLGVKIIICGDRDDAGKEYNTKVKQAIENYADYAIMDMYKLDIPEKSSIDDITRNQFDFLYQTIK